MTVLASLQVDVTCTQETKLLPKDKTHEIPQYRAVCLASPIQAEASDGGLIIHASATQAVSAIYPTPGASNVLEKLSVVIPLPGQRKILVINWHLPPESSNFLQKLGFSDS